MEVPLITRQYGFNYSTNFIYEQVVNELEEVNIENDIIYRSVPVLTKSKSEEYNKNCIKVTRSYSY
jgi:hypothetical protein